MQILALLKFYLSYILLATVFNIDNIKTIKNATNKGAKT